MKEKRTNYDRVRNMSIEEMAIFLGDEDKLCGSYCNSKGCEYFEENGGCAGFKNGIKDPCVKAICKWLESEAVEELI